MMRFRSFVLVPFILVAAACSESDDGPQPSDRLSTGFAEQGIVVAAVTQGDLVTIYTCGGMENYDTASLWFHSLQAADGTIDGESSGWQLHAEVDGTTMTGSLRDPAGVDYPWSVSPTTEGSLAGLYTASTDGCTTGVIVWESGTDESTGEPTYEGQGTWCNSASEFEQVIILEPIAITADGLPVSVDRPGFEEFFVTPF